MIVLKQYVNIKTVTTTRKANIGSSNNAQKQAQQISTREAVKLRPTYPHFYKTIYIGVVILIYLTLQVIFF